MSPISSLFFLSSIICVALWTSTCQGVQIPTASSMYNLSYVIQDDVVTFEVLAETTGYIGLGFTNISGMVSSDIFIGGVDDQGKSYFGDYTSVTTGAPSRDSIQDWTVIEAVETENSTYIKFSRLLATGDPQDIVIRDEPMKMIWSMGSTDRISYHGYSRSTLTFNLVSGTNGGEDPKPPPTMMPTLTVPTQTTTEHAAGFVDIPILSFSYFASYLIEDDTITFAVFADTTGYVGFGFTNVSGMTQADILIAGVKDDGTPYFGDYTSISPGTPELDTNPTSDWKLLEAAVVGNSTFVKFSRLLNTGDYQDIAVQDNLMNIIWSMGPDDEISSESYHGQNRGQVAFNLVSQTTETIEDLEKQQISKFSSDYTQH